MEAAPPQMPQAPALEVPMWKRPRVIFGVIFAIILGGFLLWLAFSDDGDSSAPKAAEDPSNPLPPVAKAPCDSECKCYSDVAPPKAYTPMGPGDIDYNNLQNKDNKTFCGFVKDGVRYACEPTCCTPACT